MDWLALLVPVDTPFSAAPAAAAVVVAVALSIALSIISSSISRWPTLMSMSLSPSSSLNCVSEDDDILRSKLCAWEREQTSVV